MSGNPTEEKKAKARTQLKNLTEAWREAAEEVEDAKAAFLNAADAFWKLKRTMARSAQTAEINPNEVRARWELRDVDWLLAREKGGILRYEDARIEKVLQLLEDLEKK